jgi:hypothetical protein
MVDNFGRDKCRSDLGWDLSPGDVHLLVGRSGGEVDLSGVDTFLILRSDLNTV